MCYDQIGLCAQNIDTILDLIVNTTGEGGSMWSLQEKQNQLSSDSKTRNDNSRESWLLTRWDNSWFNPTVKLVCGVGAVDTRATYLKEYVLVINDLQNIPEVVVSDDRLCTKTFEKWVLVIINYAPKNSQKWLLVMINYTACVESHCKSFTQNIYFTFEWSMQSRNNSSHKVRGWFSVTFLNRSPIFDGCVVKQGSKNKHHTNMDFRKP